MVDVGECSSSRCQLLQQPLLLFACQLATPTSLCELDSHLLAIDSIYGELYYVFPGLADCSDALIARVAIQRVLPIHFAGLPNWLADVRPMVLL